MSEKYSRQVSGRRIPAHWACRPEDDLRLLLHKPACYILRHLRPVAIKKKEKMDSKISPAVEYQFNKAALEPLFMPWEFPKAHRQRADKEGRPRMRRPAKFTPRQARGQVCTAAGKTRW